VVVAVALAQQPATRPASESVELILSDGASILLGGQGLSESELRNRVESAVEQSLRAWKAAEDDAKRAEAEKELRKALKSLFLLRLGAHEKEIESLESKVKQLRGQLDRRREKQDEIVDFRLQQLLREAEGLGWGTERVDATPGGISFQIPALGPAAATPLAPAVNPFGQPGSLNRR
jgi:hypothetical protein